jgi:DNA-binding transcriptional LysR family regulator
LKKRLASDCSRGPRAAWSHRRAIYRWEFDKGQQSLTVAVNGPLIVDDVDLVIRAALDGVGLAYLGEDRAAPYVDSGALVHVLEPWC